MTLAILVATTDVNTAKIAFPDVFLALNLPFLQKGSIIKVVFLSSSFTSTSFRFVYLDLRRFAFAIILNS